MIMQIPFGSKLPWVLVITKHVSLFTTAVRKKKESNHFDIVSDEVGKLNNGKNTYIFGDFNARIKTVCENIASDKSDEYLGIENKLDKIPISRNSEDKKLVNKRGREFLDMCRTQEETLLILQSSRKHSR